MIHSLSGGVIKDGGRHDFVKLKFQSGEERWYLSDEFSLSVGMKAIAFLNGKTQTGEVVRADSNLSAQATPVPLKTAEKIVNVVFDEE